jgi:hypothetical protein
MPSEPHVIPLSRQNNKIRPVHRDSNAAVLAHPRITRNVKGDFIPEKPAFSKTPMGSSTSRINQMRNLHPFRTYRTGPQKRNRLLSYVIVEYLEIPLLKVRDTLSGCRGNQNIETNASRKRTTSSRTLLSKSGSCTKQYRQNREYALVYGHRLTSTKNPVRNCIPGRTRCAPFQGAVPSPHQWVIAQAQSNFQSTPNLLTPTIK